MNEVQQALTRLVNESVRRARQEWQQQRLTGGPVVPSIGGTVTTTPLVWGIDPWGATSKTWGK